MWLTEFGLDLQNPDFMKLAEAFGAHGHKVEKAQDFTHTLQQAMKEKGISLIEVAFQYPDKIE